MGNSFLSALLNTAKSKITPIVTKIRLFLTPQFWRTKVITKFREVFSKIFDVKPKDKDDYYSIWRYLVSKRLAYAIVLAVGVISLVFIYVNHGVFGVGNGVKAYKYNSLLLRFTSGDDIIVKGKSGYKAYEGSVQKGVVSGRGQLFDKDENLVYQGSFENNRFNGKGTQYYNTGGVKYTGDFVENLYEGEGKLYREGGALNYDGEFSQGYKNGQGSLYDESGNMVYTGTFALDELAYVELVGKTATEVNAAYIGDWAVYESNREYCVYMSDIDAIYKGSAPEESVEDEVVVDTVYVLKDKFKMGSKELGTMEDVKSAFGEPLYKGYSMAIMPEAVAIKVMSGYTMVFDGNIDMNYAKKYTEYYSVDGYDKEYRLYLYTFERDGALYTFFCEDENSDFKFYSVMSAEEGE